MRRGVESSLQGRLEASKEPRDGDMRGGRGGRRAREEPSRSDGEMSRGRRISLQGKLEASKEG